MPTRTPSWRTSSIIGLGEAEEPELARVVSGAAAKRVPVRRRRDVHDEPVAARNEGTEQHLRTVQDAAQACIVLELPFRGAYLRQRFDDPEPRIVHEEVEPAGVSNGLPSTNCTQAQWSPTSQSMPRARSPS